MMRSIQKFFTSLKIASIMLFLLGLVSIIGTVIPQGGETRDYLMTYPRAGHWILALGCDDLYHGWFFLTLLALVTISAVVCTWTRWKITRKKIFQRLDMVSPGEVQSMIVQVPIKKDKVAEIIKAFPEPKTCDDGSKLYFFCSGRAALWGALMIHVGLVGILLGGLVDAQLGIETMIRGVEGESVPIPPVEGVRAAQKADRISRQIRGMATFNPNDPRIPALNAEAERLGKVYEESLLKSPLKMLFSKLEIDFHEGDASQEMGMIKNWKSGVSITRNGTPVASAIVRVNDPLYFEEYSFFQTDWQKKYKELVMKVVPVNASGSASPASQPLRLVASLFQPVKPDWSPYTFEVRSFYPDFRMGEGGSFISVSDDLNNPAVQLEAFDAEKKLVGRAWAFAEAMSAVAGHDSSLPYKFIVEGANPAYQSGLQITSYPGVPLVWLGCFLFSLGMALTFYVSYFETWFLEKKDGKGLLAISGNRHPHVLRKHLEEFTGKHGIERTEK